MDLQPLIEVIVLSSKEEEEVGEKDKNSESNIEDSIKISWK